MKAVAGNPAVNSVILRWFPPDQAPSSHTRNAAFDALVAARQGDEYRDDAEA